MSLSSVSLWGQRAGDGRPRRYAFLSTCACLVVIKVTRATGFRWLGKSLAGVCTAYSKHLEPVGRTRLVAATSPHHCAGWWWTLKTEADLTRRMCASPGGLWWCVHDLVPRPYQNSRVKKVSSSKSKSPIEVVRRDSPTCAPLARQPRQGVSLSLEAGGPLKYDGAPL